MNKYIKDFQNSCIEIQNLCTAAEIFYEKIPEKTEVEGIMYNIFKCIENTNNNLYKKISAFLDSNFD